MGFPTHAARQLPSGLWTSERAVHREQVVLPADALNELPADHAEAITLPWLRFWKMFKAVKALHAAKPVNILTILNIFQRLEHLDGLEHLPTP